MALDGGIRVSATIEDGEIKVSDQLKVFDYIRESTPYFSYEDDQFSNGNNHPSKPPTTTFFFPKLVHNLYQW